MWKLLNIICGGMYLSSEIEPIFYSKTDPLLRKIYDLIGRFWWDIDPLPHLFHGSLEYEPPPNMLLGS